jgi:hypothetical protein
MVKKKRLFKKVLRKFFISKYIYWAYYKYVKPWRKYTKDLEKFKNIHEGENCFIIGNGPSLNKMDLKPLSKCNAFGMNKIFLIFKKVKLKLSYYVAVNPYVVKQSVKEIRSMACPVFLPLMHKKMFKNSVGVYYITNKASEKPFAKDISRNRVSEGWTVTYVAMQIAYYMGFKNVFLIGVDHNFKCKGEPNELQLLNEEDKNHFDPNYFKGKEWQLPDLKNSEKAYKLAKKIFKKDGRKIYDATVGGNLNIFQKISYEDALKMCDKSSEEN